MTASTLSRLPLQAGSALATGAGHAFSAAGRAILWGIARYSRAPLANTSILALTVFTAMAGSNALYLQDARHPAPLFGPAPDVEIGLPDPVTTATRKTALTVPNIVVIDETTGSIPAAAPVASQPAPEPIGNGEIVELQRKLTMLGLYEGKVDGVFGPKTAGAIRRFEQRAGLPADGRLTPEILDAVASAPLVVAPQATAEPPRAIAVIPVQPAATMQPAIVVQPPVAVASVEVTGSIPPANVGNPAAPEDSFQPLPDPAPLQLSLNAATAPQSIIKPRRDLPDSPREVLNLAVATAKNGIDALASVIENGPQLGPIPPASIAPVAPVPATQSIAPQPVAQQPVEVQAAIQQPIPPLPEPTTTAAIAAPATIAPQTIAPATIAPAATIAPPATEVAVAQPTATPAAVAEPQMDVPVIVVADTAPTTVTPPPTEPMTEQELIAKIQRGLSSLGFLRGEVDGVAGEATAKAIRNFEVYYNYDVTGRVTPGLLDLLIAAGAQT